MNIPTQPQDISKEWLASVLQPSGLLHNMQISTLEVERLPSVTSQLLRLYLRYLPDSTDAPATLLVKLPSADPQQRQLLFTLTHHYTREVFFFNELASQVPIRIPRCYYSASIADEQQSILVLEDLAPMHNLDSVQGCPASSAARAINTVARLHAVWWQHQRLAELLPLSFDTPTFAQQMQQLYQHFWSPFITQQGTHLPTAFRVIGERLGQQITWLYDQLQQPPMTLLHVTIQA